MYGEPLSISSSIAQSYTAFRQSRSWILSWSIFSNAVRSSSIDESASEIFSGVSPAKDSSLNKSVSFIPEPPASKSQTDFRVPFSFPSSLYKSFFFWVIPCLVFRLSLSASASIFEKSNPKSSSRRYSLRTEKGVSKSTTLLKSIPSKRKCPRLFIIWWTAK